MNLSVMHQRFVDRTARKPEGKWAVKSYNAPRGHYRSFRKILELLRLESGDSYCEIGCGGGVLLNWALQKAGSGAAIDHSEEMVSLSIRNNEDFVRRNMVEISRGSAENLPWASGSFTACGCANMFFFLEEPDKALAEIFRVLKPGGRFAMATMGKRMFGKLVFGFLYGLKTYSDQTMTEMLEGAGFRDIRVTTGIFGMQICYAEKQGGRDCEQHIGI